MKSAYINLYDKSNLLDITNTISSLKYEIYSQGSTFDFLIKNEINAKEVKSENFHPNIEIIGLITGKKKLKIPKPDIIISDIPENYDDLYNTLLLISAISNGIITISDTSDIPKVDSYLKLFGEISKDFKKELIYKTLNKLSYIFSYKSYNIFPYINTSNELINIPLKKTKKLEYGENPHQKCIIYSSPLKSDFRLKDIKVLNGKLNLNHYLDIKKSIDILKDINDCVAISLKHSNISSIAIAENLQSAVDKIKEYDCDNGKTYALNNVIDIKIMQKLENLMPQSIIAPCFLPEVIEYVMKKNPNLKLISFSRNLITPPLEQDIIYLEEDFAVQDKDIFDETVDMKYISRKYSIENMRDIKLAFVISKHLKTYCSVIVSNGTALSVSQGQESTYFAITTAVFKMNKKNMIKFKKDIIIATDGSLDINSINEITKLPVRTLIHGTTKTDRDIIKIANDNNISLLETKKRHLKHI